jgi:hypothetical protein
VWTFGHRARARDRRVPHDGPLRSARLHESDALLANALHFGSDFAGTPLSSRA